MKFMLALPGFVSFRAFYLEKNFLWPTLLNPNGLRTLCFDQKKNSVNIYWIDPTHRIVLEVPTFQLGEDSNTWEIIVENFQKKRKYQTQILY